MLAVEGVPVVGVESGAEFPTLSRISTERSMGRNNKSMLRKIYEQATRVRNLKLSCAKLFGWWLTTGDARYVTALVEGQGPSPVFEVDVTRQGILLCLQIPIVPAPRLDTKEARIKDNATHNLNGNELAEDLPGHSDISGAQSKH